MIDSSWVLIHVLAQRSFCFLGHTRISTLFRPMQNLENYLHSAAQIIYCAQAPARPVLVAVELVRRLLCIFELEDLGICGQLSWPFKSTVASASSRASQTPSTVSARKSMEPTATYTAYTNCAY